MNNEPTIHELAIESLTRNKEQNKQIILTYIKDHKGFDFFENEKELKEFLIYCEYMIFSYGENFEPIPLIVEYKDKFRGYYKTIQMYYEEDILKDYHENQRGI